MDREIERHLRWLMVLRLVTVSTLLLSVFVVDLFLSPARSPVPIYVVALFTYVMCLGYGLAFARFRARQSFLVFQN